MGKQYAGKAVYKGTACGKIHVLKKKNIVIDKSKKIDPDEEKERVRVAIEDSVEQLQKLYEKALEEVGEESAAIFEVHQMLLQGEEFGESITEGIEEGLCAEEAVQKAGKEYAELFAAMDDEYMRARSADFIDLSNRVVNNLLGESGVIENMTEPAIIVADDLTPSETVSMDKQKILAFVTIHGSSNSHTAILARMMNIPALIGVDLDLEALDNEMRAIVDGEKQLFIVEPSEKEIEEAKEKISAERDSEIRLQQVIGKENITKAGRKIELFANIGAVEDVSYAIANDAGGIGLFRSEFLYIGKERLPDEEEQFAAYKAVLEAMSPKKVVIRTLDIGADKKADYLQLEEEENPALGYRAIRICLTEKEIFKTQLRALFRASVYGNLAIMYPMIISVQEVQMIKKMTEEIRNELSAQGIPYGTVEEGIMIETPAAALISDELAKYVDFFSVGTNDLTQYTLAIDRQNENLEAFYDPHHPAVLKMIKMAADHIHEQGKWIGICGELGADLSLTKTFLDMGIDELSVSPSMILKIREQILEMDE